MPTTIVSMPAGNGGTIGVPSTACAGATGILSARPVRASSALTIAVLRHLSNMGIS